MDKNKILLIMFCIFLPLLILLFSYKVNLYFINLTDNQQNAINFLDNKEDLISDYTNNEKSHMQDVKKLIQKINYFFYLLLLIITLILTSYKRNKVQIIKLLKFGGITAFISLLIILLFILFSFNKSFIIFHEIFFSQGNWQFPFNSLLIQTFPLTFFITISKKIFLTSLIASLIIIFVSILIKRKI